MTTKPENVVPIDEMLKDTDKQLGAWLKEAEGDSATQATIKLAQYIHEPWYRFIKESGASSQDIIHAMSRFIPALICEIAANTAKPGTETLMANIITKLITVHVEAGMKSVMAQKAKGENMAFRKRDS